MSEPLREFDDMEVKKLSDAEFLNGLGFSFITPPKPIKRHSAQRMSEFDNYNWADINQRRARIIAVAYYALELSTPLKPFDAAMSAVEKLEPEDRETSQQLIDNLLVALMVDEILSKAHDLTLSFGVSLEEMRRRTADYTKDNTGALAALNNMTIRSEKLGYISSFVALNSENLLRVAIAQEKGIELPL